LMSQAHVGHNCKLGNGVIMATGATLGGHVVVEDQAFISGNCVVHQHCRIGRLVIMRGLSRAARDLPPFAIIDGTHTVRGLNRVGLRRAGFDRERVRALATAFRILFRARTNLAAATARVDPEVRSAAVSYLVYAGIRTTSMYYFELGEFVARRDGLVGETLRVKGWVKQGSVRWDAHTNELAFELATKEGGSPVPVAYRGIRPDMFSEGREVVVEGRYQQ